MTVVVDASVALKWVLPEKDTKNALEFWDEWEDAAEPVVAPPIFRAEITNALHKRARRGDISHLDALEMLGSLLGIVAIREPEGLYTSALSLADELGMSASYDALCTWLWRSPCGAGFGPRTAPSIGRLAGATPGCG